MCSLSAGGGVAPQSQALYGVNMPRARHPKKDVEAALAWAEAAEWRGVAGDAYTFRPSVGRDAL